MSAISESAAPRAKTIAQTSEIHGRTRVDDYAWLRDRDDPDTTAYLEAENSYADGVLAPHAALREELYHEMLGHIVQTDLSVPYRLGEYFYYSRTEEGKQYPILARKRGSIDAPEEITLDVNRLAEGHPYLGIGAYKISPDARFLAYTVDTTGYRQYTLRIRDLSTGEDLPDRIESAGSVAWAADNRTLFLTTEDDVTKRRDKFWRYAVGDGSPELVYEEPDERFDVAATTTNDRAFVLLGSFSKSTTHWQALPTAGPFELRELLPRVEGHRYGVEHHGTSFYILTNRGAEDFRLVRAPENDASEARWAEIVPERAGVHIADIDAFEHHLVLHVRKGGYASLEVLDLRSGALAEVPCDETVHTVSPSTNLEFHTDRYRFSYSSLVTPESIYELDLDTLGRTLLKETPVPGYDRSKYDTTSVLARSADGTLVPISIVRRADLPLDGTGAMVLYGYGSYGLSIDPFFSASRLALLDRGIAFAIAHIRGGGELGERWRTAGHLQNKLNTFDDFVACADHVVTAGYASRHRLVIQGGSAGGLLVGASSNLRPDLCAAVVSHVPFVDVMNTMLDATLPLTTAEYLEWGDPNIEADYAYMMRYSPYDNVRAASYPAMLVKVSVHDSQVPYWEGAKLVAKLRATATTRGPLLLYTNFGAGHGGASGRYDRLRETAFDDAFILSIVSP